MRQAVCVDRLFLAADAGQPLRRPPSRRAPRHYPPAPGRIRRGAATKPRSSRLLLEAAADAVAGVCGDPNALVAFLPGLPIAIRAAVEDVGARRPGVLTTAVDRLLVQRLATEPPIPVDRSGRVNPADVEKALIRTGAGVFMCQVGNPKSAPGSSCRSCMPCAGAQVRCWWSMRPWRRGGCRLDFEWDVLVLDARSWAGSTA